MQSKFLFNHQHVNQSISQSVHHLPLLFTNSDYLYLCLLGKALGFCIFFTKRFLVTFFWAVGWLVVFLGFGCGWVVGFCWLFGWLDTYIHLYVFLFFAGIFLVRSVLSDIQNTSIYVSYNNRQFYIFFW